MDHGNDDGAAGRLLILGGTGEARALAALLAEAGRLVTTSLAGRTGAPLLPAGEVRIGGFGGPEGLAAYLTRNRIARLVDATHPFAARISAHAVAASAATGIPLIRLERPAWTPPPGARWIGVPDMDGAVGALPAGARVLLTVGRQQLAGFSRRRDCRFVARMIEVPPGLDPDWTVITGRGPFTLAGESALMETHAITHLVSKNSGGGQTAAKLEAAARLGIVTVMVERPLLPPARTAASIEEALALL